MESGDGGEIVYERCKMGVCGKGFKGKIGMFLDLEELV